MATAIFVNGPTLVQVNGTELGLSDSAIQITLQTSQQDVIVDAWGGQFGVNDVQQLFAEASIRMTLVHYDRAFLDTVIQLSFGAAAVGQIPRPGTLMGSSGSFQSLRLTSPTGGKPWTFPTAWITETPFSVNLGVEKSIVTLNWRAIPTFDSSPYNDGSGSASAVLWTYT